VERHGGPQRAEILDSERVPVIDSLRGLAALAVALFHFSVGNTEFYAPPILKSIGGFGFYGVDVFFVISGFILPWSMWRAGYQLNAGTFRRFLWKRVVRIEPPYLVTILLVVVLAWLSTLVPGYRGQPFRLDLAQIGWHLGYLTPLVHQQWLNPVFWTLAVECQFYVLIAVVFSLIASPRRGVRLGVVAVLLAASFWRPADEALTSQLAQFVIGIAVFQFTARVSSAKETMLVLLSAAGLVYTGLGAGSMVVCLGTAGVIVFAPMWVGAGLARPALSFFGTISYSLYLIHVPIGGRIINLAQRLPPSNFTSLVAIFVAGLVSVGAAYALYRLVERPAQRYAGSLRFHGRD
jgi:peptidoglycan/LPS O-acetylase OafA/YrhL